MIIDTIFNIDDEVWIPRYIEAIRKYEVRSVRILSFQIYEGGCYIVNEYASVKIRVDNCYTIFDECQLACDKLNSK